jgi:hypothetical protein
MNPVTPLHKKLFWLSLFAIAMGFLETSVVIYLRELYYPSGFKFPLQVIPEHIARVEIFREAATIFMLVGAAYLAGHSKTTRFAYFLIAFSIWDIFYYVFLYVFLAWPESLLTWDILFLIPFPWTGPVIAPCLVCVGLICLAWFILHFEAQGKAVKIHPMHWFLLISGCVIIICSFLSDYFSILHNQHTSASFLPSKEGLFTELKTYVPQQFNWFLFLSGLFISSVGTFLFAFQYSNLQTQKK